MQPRLTASDCLRNSASPPRPQEGNAPDEPVPERTYAVFQFISGNLHGYLAAVSKFGQARWKLLDLSARLDVVELRRWSDCRGLRTLPAGACV